MSAAGWTDVRAVPLVTAQRGLTLAVRPRPEEAPPGDRFVALHRIEVRVRGVHTPSSGIL